MLFLKYKRKQNRLDVLPIDIMKSSSLSSGKLYRVSEVTAKSARNSQTSHVGTGSEGGIIAEDYDRKDDRFVSRNYCLNQAVAAAPKL